MLKAVAGQILVIIFILILMVKYGKAEMLIALELIAKITIETQ
jgi:hypothetical protein